MMAALAVRAKNERAVVKTNVLRLGVGCISPPENNSGRNKKVQYN
jgi:hypothetical protein